MKNLHMSWDDIKNTPKHELMGLIYAYSEYNVLHSFDGYNEKEVNEMAKNKPEVRNQWSEYKAAQRKYNGNRKQEKVTSFRQLVK